MKLRTLALSVATGLATVLTFAGTAQADRNRYQPQRGGAIVFYEHPDFYGQSLPVSQDERSLGRLGFNDKASSVQVFSGRWEVCVDGDFRGTCRILDASTPQLSNLRLNDNISSVRRLDGAGYGRNDHWSRDQRRGRDDHRGNRAYDRHGSGGYNSGLVLFEDTGFDGRALPVTGDISDLGRSGMNDKASSVQVNAGRWLVCSDPSFRGRCEIVNRSNGRLNYIRMNDNISSVRRIG